MIEARADDTERDRPQRDIVDRVGVASARHVATCSPPHADDHANGDNNAVGTQRN